MNSCLRCQGLLVEFFDEALGHTNIRCVACGCRPLDPPPRDPIPHGLCKPKYGGLRTCECGKEKVEWRQTCTECSRKKLAYYQRKRALEKLSRARRQSKLKKEVSA